MYCAAMHRKMVIITNIMIRKDLKAEVASDRG